MPLFRRGCPETVKKMSNLAGLLLGLKKLLCELLALRGQLLLESGRARLQRLRHPLQTLGIVLDLPHTADMVMGMS